MMKIGIIPGRYNPPTKGHLRLFKHALEDNDLVYAIIIQGEKTGADLVRNPLPFELKKEIISRAEPKVLVGRHSPADIPAIATKIIDSVLSYDKKYYFSIYVGSDRASKYAIQIKSKYVEQIKRDLNDPDLDITFEIRALERDESSKSVEGYSASKVRDAIRAGNDEKAMAMLAIDDEDIYERIKGAILAGVKKEAVETKINTILEELE